MEKTIACSTVFISGSWSQRGCSWPGSELYTWYWHWPETALAHEPARAIIFVIRVFHLGHVSHHSSCLSSSETWPGAGRWHKPVMAVRAVLLDTVGHPRLFQNFIWRRRPRR